MKAAVEREELAQIVYLSTYPDPASTGIQPLAERSKWEQDSHRGAADAILAAGYRKPRTICYVILDGDASPQARYATKAAAEEVRDAWIAAHESAGVPHNFRVAEIVEASA